ncbi:MAG: hypothetical protein Q7S51_06785 [Gallionellaceae bacterium]|nr:hypothetical protein [Gallionellaceae bacterium]
MIFAKSKPKKRITLRPMTTFSMLPASSFMTTNASLYIDEHLSFSATRVEEESDYYELAWCDAEEIALLSSIVVGIHPDHGKAFLFPARWPFYLEDNGEDLSNPELLAEIVDTLKNEIAVRFASGKDTNSWEELPPFLKNRPYEFNSKLNSTEYHLFLFEHIKPNDTMLIRGLSHLLKCGMLRCLGRSFVDTACLEIYVSLEATLQIILNRLRLAGNPNPTNRDASNYLLSAFNEPAISERYYGEYYDDRIRAIHPNSRFGAAKFTPLYVDDLYMLYNDLLRTYEFLITGVPNSYMVYPTAR